MLKNNFCPSRHLLRKQPYDNTKMHNENKSNFYRVRSIFFFLSTTGGAKFHDWTIRSFHLGPRHLAGFKFVHATFSLWLCTNPREATLESSDLWIHTPTQSRLFDLPEPVFYRDASSQKASRSSQCLWPWNPIIGNTEQQNIPSAVIYNRHTTARPCFTALLW